jgi:hypothetical protein
MNCPKNNSIYSKISHTEARQQRGTQGVFFEHPIFIAEKTSITKNSFSYFPTVLKIVLLYQVDYV